MWPILLKVGPISIHTYGAFVAAGFLAAYGWMVRLAKAQNISHETILDFCWVLMLSGIAGARLLYVAFNFHYFIQSPAEIIKIWQGGLVFYGGLIAASLAGFVWVKRKNLSRPMMADIVAPALALGHAFGRLGCFAAGCCFGKFCDLPWAVTFNKPETLAPREVPLHPSQLYEAGLNFVLFLILNALARREKGIGTGRPAAVYVLSYSLIRFFVEFTRADDRGPLFLLLTSTQWVAIATFIAAAAWLLSRSLKKPARA